MDIRNFKVTAQTKKRIDFTCEGKGRLVKWNQIEGFASGPLENNLWPAEWVVVIHRGGKQIKRRMKLSERSEAITRTINVLVARYVARSVGPRTGPLEANKDWPASSKDKMARSGSKGGSKGGPQGQTKPWPAEGQKSVARTVALPGIHEMDIQPGPTKDPLDIPDFLRR